MAAFLAAAQRGTTGTFSTLYRTTVPDRGRTRYVTVYSAQRTYRLLAYRETPSLWDLGPSGSLSRGFEFFAAVAPLAVNYPGQRPGDGGHQPPTCARTEGASARRARPRWLSASLSCGAISAVVRSSPTGTKMGS